MSDKSLTMRVAAVIVTFNPDIERLCENLKAASPQVGKILIVDNGSVNTDKFDGLDSVSYIKSLSNMGIAWALNRAFEWAHENGFNWLLTLDQDSVIESDYVKKMTRWIADHAFDVDVRSATAIIYPRFVDARIAAVESEASSFTRVIRALKNAFLTLKPYLPITSGSLVNVEKACLCELDEDYFIDDVDHYFDFKLLKAGYVFCEAGNVVLDHRLGEPHGIGEEKSGGIGGQFRSFVSLHQAWRYYYMYRNRVWLHRFFFISPLWFVDDVLFLARIPLYWLKNERRTVQAMLCGVVDGLLGLSRKHDEITRRFK